MTRSCLLGYKSSVVFTELTSSTYTLQEETSQNMNESYGSTDSPIRATLSTSTSSFDALDPHDPNLSKLATKMFRKTEEYLADELNAPLEDYKLLTEMNRATIAKYKDMKQIADNLVTSTANLDQQIKDLEPYLKQIDEIEKTVDKLEAAAYKLDAHTLALETKFKSLLH